LLRLFRCARKPKNVYERFIEYRWALGSHGKTVSLDSDTQNPVLLKAIELYIHHNCQLQLNSANLDLTSMESNSRNRNCYGNYGGEGTSTFAGMLSKYQIITKPLRNQRHDLGAFGSARV
jgi:hypothetical protein